MPYSGLPFNAIVYEGFLPDSPQATGGGPQSNVVDIDDNIGRLGCGEPSVFITSRCGGGVTCVLTDNVASLKWTRVLDDVSEAEITLNFGGTPTETCCECLAEVEPWCNELHIWRDGVEVWVGPILQVEYTYNGAVVRASDSLAWLSVRINEGNIDYTTATGAGAADLRVIAEDIIQTAFADSTGTCELDALFAVNTGEVSQRFFEGFTDTALNHLLDLAETGLNVTTIGRTIVLTGDDTPLTPLILLSDEHIIGDIKVTKDGTVQGNRYYVHFDGDGGIPASGEAANFFCYDPIERLRDGDGLVDGVTAAAVADAYVEASAISPRRVEIESGSKLSPDTPWEINQMVCGARVDVAVTRLCVQLTQSFILTGVEVSYTDADESVSISLTPLNEVELA